MVGWVGGWGGGAAQSLKKEDFNQFNTFKSNHWEEANLALRTAKLEFAR